MSPYTYSPLSKSNKIRLLKLLPHSDKNAPIECELMEYTLPEAHGRRPYDALSYVWGSGEKPRSVIIDDDSLPVTENLYAVLLQLRDHEIARMLWADAICINQDDEDEKSLQVPLMRAIYGQADRVVVWLGQEAEGSSEALAAIQLAAEDPSRITIRPSVSQGYTPPFERHTRDAYLALLKRAWFRRVWVLQEVGLARAILIMCGSSRIDGYAFGSGVRHLSSVYPLDSTLQGLVLPVCFLIRGAIFRREYQSQSRGVNSLGELIDMYQAHEATRSHDKIYALMGLSSEDSSSPALRPNYRLPWNEVFQRAVEHILPDHTSVHCWPETYTAVIKGKGYILGVITQVQEPGSQYDGQSIEVAFAHNVLSRSRPQRSGSWYVALTIAKAIYPGDVVCQLKGASNLSIIRLSGSRFTLIGLSAIRLSLQVGNWEELRESANSDHLYDLCLEWSWGATLDGTATTEISTKLNYSQDDSTERSNQGVMARIWPKLLTTVLKLYHVPGQSNTDPLARLHITEVFRTLLGQASLNLPIADDVVVAAARHEYAGYAMKLLFRYRGDTFPVSEETVKAVAQRPDGHFVFKLLLGWMGDRLPITTAVLEEAAKNTENGLQILRLLIEKRGHLPITEAVLEESAKNEATGLEILHLLLENGGSKVPISDRLAKAAVRNENDGTRIAYLLIRVWEDDLPITEEVIQEAMKNRSKGDEILAIVPRFRDMKLPEKVESVDEPTTASY
ncbi:heterokaryon incompatibility protein-domain-containing protein [Aspergillus avenaceus]|uniref:Heterokaryon incompatibility protein-domain-containing protein n=1 Tax=Aspergillus avenaceus TaxID=36643 RepID=A0A5N6U9P0_ASPAV|nr:heterokaryon incompatibility protein-domain-containing protein [Aspergillus avenaceus]